MGRVRKRNNKPPKDEAIYVKSDKHIINEIKNTEDIGLDPIDSFIKETKKTVLKKKALASEKELEVLGISSSEDEQQTHGESWGSNRKVYYDKDTEEQNAFSQEEEEVERQTKSKLEKMSQKDFTDELLGEMRKGLTGLKTEAEEERLLRLIDEKLLENSKTQPKDNEDEVHQESKQLLEQLQNSYETLEEDEKEIFSKFSFLDEASAQIKEFYLTKKRLHILYMTNISFYLYLRQMKIENLETHPIITSLLELGNLIHKLGTYEIESKAKIINIIQQSLNKSNQGSLKDAESVSSENDHQSLSESDDSDTGSSAETEGMSDTDMIDLNMNFIADKNKALIDDEKNNLSRDLIDNNEQTELSEDISSLGDELHSSESETEKRKTPRVRFDDSINMKKCNYSTREIPKFKTKEETDNLKRAATHKILNNKGLRKLNKNTNAPKRKKRMKFENAIKTLNKKNYGTASINKNGFEYSKTYIKKNVSRSTKFK